MSVTYDRSRTSRFSIYAILFGRIALIAAAIVPMLVAYRSATATVQSEFQQIYWLMGFAVALTVPMFYLTRTRWAVANVYISSFYDSFAIMLAAHYLGSVVGPYPVLLSIMVVSAGSQLRSRMWQFAVVIAYIALLYLAFAWLELSAMAAAGSSVMTDTMAMGNLGVSDDTWHKYVPLMYLVAVGQLSLILSVTNARLNYLFRRNEEQATRLVEANAALSRSTAAQLRLSEQLQAAAGELSSGAIAQASSASEQAAAMMEVSVTVEQLNQTAQQIADAAAAVATAAEQTMTSATRGQDAVRDSIIGMALIKQRVNDITSRILTLSERSQRINEILDLINNIAGETHLLSLNASIEAAGAGAEGQRFAVVASEVKKLSQRVVLAVRDVRIVIKELQAATNAAVMATEDGMKETDKGVGRAHTSGDANEDIIQMVGRTTQLASAISLATQQQRTASEQVNYTIRDVAELSRSAMDISQQASTAAERVRQIAAQLGQSEALLSPDGHGNDATPSSQLPGAHGQHTTARLEPIPPHASV